MDNKNFLMIDGLPVAIDGEKNLLDVIRKAGIDLPTFCYYTELSTYGACRMCMVESADGKLLAACSTPPQPGMSIKTNTQRLRKYRKMILELMLSNHCRDCTTCAKNNDCKLQALAKRFNIEGVRFPNGKSSPMVDDSSVSITIDHSKCILCGDCVRTCREIQHIGAIDFMGRGSKMKVGTAFDSPIAETICVGCGQCAQVCPTGAVVLKDDTAKVWKELDDPDTMVTVQIAPAVRVAIGQELGLEEGDNSIGRIAAALRRLGFDKVYDTSSGADLTVIEESAELLEHVKAGNELPLFSSCCPAWVHFCEDRYPELMPHVSSCKSPMQMLAKVLREHHAGCGKRHVHVALMPCTAKKYERAREEFRGADGTPDVDYVLTTVEFIRMVKEAGINMKEIYPEAVDMPFATMAGAAVIFGVTGGVTEAVLRRVSTDRTNGAMARIAYQGVRGMDGLKVTDVTVGDKTLHIGVVSGLGNTERLLRRIKKGEHFDFVEVMACPRGCISGGGQPFGLRDVKERRAEGLYEADRLSPIKRSDDNPLVDALYGGMLKGNRAHELLHVDYLKNK